MLLMILSVMDDFKCYW